MRIKAALIILLVAGIILTAGLLIDNKTLNPAQMDQVTNACMECHGEIPAYDAPGKVHHKHVAFKCSQCHSHVSGLEAADNGHAVLEWIAAGMMLLALAGMIANLLIVRRKDKGN